MLRAVSLLVSAAAVLALPEEYVRANGGALWESFKRTHARAYRTDEEARRYAVFMDNMVEAARLEKTNPHATFGANKFADLTKEEFKVYHSLKVPSRLPANKTLRAGGDAPTEVDWRSHGAVTGVKDQARCGSCWAFSSTGGIEGAWALAGHGLVSLSEQELVSCDKTSWGCRGGLQSNAYDWLINTRGGNISTEASYPYSSSDNTVAACDLAGKTDGAHIDLWSDASGDEGEMARQVGTKGPLPIAVDASAHWQTYTGGVVSGCTGTTLDHGVLIVGYSADYWIIKNSWGFSWGESGYMRLARGSNQCGLTQQAVFPYVSTYPHAQ